MRLRIALYSDKTLQTSTVPCLPRRNTFPRHQNVSLTISFDYWKEKEKKVNVLHSLHFSISSHIFIIILEKQQPRIEPWSFNMRQPLYKSSQKYSIVLTSLVSLPTSLKPKTRYWLIAFSREKGTKTLTEKNKRGIKTGPCPFFFFCTKKKRAST